MSQLFVFVMHKAFKNKKRLELGARVKKRREWGEKER